MIVSAREFTSAAEIFASAAAVRQRCFHPRVRPAPKAIVVEALVPEEKAEPTPEPKWSGGPRPLWTFVAMRFDEHVLAFRGETEVMAPGRRPVSDIVGEVLHAFPGFTIADLKSGRRQRDLCFARQTAMYVVRHERPDLSYPVIGRWFGGRDHTTVMSSVRKIAALRGEV